jgi:threonine/homoserine/homoserine lactone efflux protein
MEKTFAQILPLAVGGTFSPSGLLLVMAILSSNENPKRKALSFIIGSSIFLTVLGILIVLLVKPAVQAASHPHKLSGYIDIALGLLIIILAGKSFLSRNKKAPQKKKERKIPYTLVGFSFMLVNTSTLVLFIAASKIIADNRLARPDTILLLLVLIIITMFMISFPVAISFAMPERSERILKPVTSFMSRHGSQIARVYFLLMAFYLIIHGARLINS